MTATEHDLAVATAERYQALELLSKVMATLASSAESPRKAALYARCIAFLAEHGMDPGAEARRRHEQAYEAWMANR